MYIKIKTGEITNPIDPEKNDIFSAGICMLQLIYPEILIKKKKLNNP